jgi:hypothetical protein
MSFPFLVPFTAEDEFTQSIHPRFPNWERSFVSGTESPLFTVEHRIHESDHQLLLSRVQFKAKSEGPPGHVHGGASAGLLDELMGVVVWNQNFFCVTQSIQVHYGRALPLDIDAWVMTQIKLVHPKTIEVWATIFDKKKIPYVSSQGIFHQLTSEQLKRFKSLT